MRVDGRLAAMADAFENRLQAGLRGLSSSKPQQVEVPKELVTIEKRTRVENVREYTPNVIEPSFGIGRIVYVSTALVALEH